MNQSVAVEKQGITGAAEKAGELIEQTRADSDELVFGPPQCLGQLHAKQVVLPVVEVAAGSFREEDRAGSRTRRKKPGGSPSWRDRR